MKKLVTLTLVLTLTLGMTMIAWAEISPKGEMDTTQTEDKAEKAPKTGESNLMLYGMSMAALLAGVAIVAGRKAWKIGDGMES